MKYGVQVESLRGQDVYRLRQSQSTVLRSMGRRLGLGQTLVNILLGEVSASVYELRREVDLQCPAFSSANTGQLHDL